MDWMCSVRDREKELQGFLAWESERAVLSLTYKQETIGKTGAGTISSLVLDVLSLRCSLDIHIGLSWRQLDFQSEHSVEIWARVLIWVLTTYAWYLKERRQIWTCRDRQVVRSVNREFNSMAQRTRSFKSFGCEVPGRRGNQSWVVLKSFKWKGDQLWENTG